MSDLTPKPEKTPSKHEPASLQQSKDSSTDKKPTDISLISDDGKNHKYQKDNPSIWQKRGYQLLLVALMIAGFLAVIVYQTLLGKITQPSQEISINDGDTYYGVLPTFQNNVPLFSASIAKLYIKYNVHTPLKAGTYELPANPNLRQMLNTLQQEQNIVMLDIQIIEGKTAKDLYQTLANTDGIVLEVLNEDGTPKGDIKQLLGIAAHTPEGEFNQNLEGWFAPNTYHYAKGVTDKQILTDLYTRQQQILDTAWQNRAEDLPYQSAYDALILASIIEKETGIAAEREKVASVFVNRLNQGMRLQTDPTIIYGMGERYDGNIRRKDINEKTAYNTYQIDGLPPTPIALPSEAAITAALHPSDSDALFFVATGKGGHTFSKTLEEHNQAVQAYLQTIRQNKTQQHDQQPEKPTEPDSQTQVTPDANNTNNSAEQ